MLDMSTTRVLPLLLLVCLAITATTADWSKEDRNYWYSEAKKDLQRSKEKQKREHRAKNVILFVGDGMGVITHTMARIYKGQKKDSYGEEEELGWEKFPFSGLIKTYNTDHQVPDSAGTATALMSGVKTRMGVLGVDTSVPYNSCQAENLKKGSIPSLKDWARKQDKKVGIVTTARITHATPGAMYAHTPCRDWEADADIPQQYKGCVKDIAAQLMDNLIKGDVEFAMGGGAANFLPVNKNGSRMDMDIIEKLKKKGIKIVRDTNQLKGWDYKTKMLGLFGNSHMDYEAFRNKNDVGGQPSLAEMTRQALNRLKKHEKGYVLLVEGGRVDHAHHNNQAKLAMEETMMLEKAVKVATDMTDESDTLILVTADHSHAVTMSGYPRRGNDILGYNYEDPNDMDKHRFMLTKENKTQPYQTISYANGPGFNNHFDKTTRDWKNISEMDWEDWNYTQPATYFLPYETHGGEDVAVYARGPMAHYVTGLHEQSYLGVLMAHAACINPDQFGCPAAKNGASTNRLGLILVPVILYLTNSAF